MEAIISCPFADGNNTEEGEKTNNVGKRKKILKSFSQKGPGNRIYTQIKSVVFTNEANASHIEILQRHENVAWICS
jgi:hypothetical protein